MVSSTKMENIALLGGEHLTNSEKEFIEEFIKKISRNIVKYNKNDNVSKRDILKQIQSDMRAIDHELPDSKFEQWQSFTEMQEKLFTAIQSQLDYSGRESTLDPASLPEIITNMSPTKVNQLLGILNKRFLVTLQEDLNNLYAPDDNSPEAGNFRVFLSNHTISFLGGFNSKNFAVESNVSGNKLVLKIDNRLDMPRATEDKLRANEAFKNRFIPVYSERRANDKIASNKIISRMLLVTDYCDGGSVEEYCRNLTTVDAQLSEAGKIFAQMARTLLDFQKNDCMFPDAKIENWLVESNGNLVISDTKSFLHLKSIGSEVHLLYSNYYTPPEFARKTGKLKIHADSAHAYILGKNLYYAMGGIKSFPPNDSNLIFGANAFQTEKGAKFKDLIQELVKDKPEKRLSMPEAHERLFLINNPEFENVVQKLKSLESKSEIGIRRLDFMRAKLLEAIDNPADKPEILADLERLYSEPEKLPFEQNAFKKFINIVPVKVKEYFNGQPEFEEMASALRSLDFIKGDTKIEGYIREQQQKFNNRPEKKQQVLGELQSKVEAQIVNITQSINNRLNEFAFGPEDKNFDIYIENKRSELAKATDFNELKDILLDMKNTVERLEQDQGAARLKAIIKKYRANVKWYTVGKGAKANKIEKAIAELPLEDRLDFVNSPKTKKVMEALASHRAIGKRGKVYKDSEQNIITNRAARQFKLFIQPINNSNEQEKPPEPGQGSGNNGPKP